MTHRILTTRLSDQPSDAWPNPDDLERTLWRQARADAWKDDDRDHDEDDDRDDDDRDDDRDDDDRDDDDRDNDERDDDGDDEDRGDCRDDDEDSSASSNAATPVPEQPASQAPARFRGDIGGDRLEPASWETERVNGGKGSDLADLGDALWQSDLSLDGSDLILTDRFSDQAIRLRDLEEISIGGHVFAVDALVRSLQGDATPVLFSQGLSALKVNTTDPTPSVLWDQVAQFLVMETQPGPTHAARVFAMVHTAIYDAYAAHDARALRVSIDLDGDNVETLDARSEDIEAAMHHAGHAVLEALFPGHRDLLDRVMEDRLDLSPGDSDDSAARIGLDAAGDILRLRPAEADRVGAADAAPYTPVNPNPDTVHVIDAWTPEWRKSTQDPQDPQVQTFLSPEFPTLEPFALPQTGEGITDFAAFRPPAPEPFFLEGFMDAKLDIASRTVTLSSAATINGAPFAAGDTLPVTRELIGAVVNPAFIAQAERLIEVSAALSPQDRAVAEFWEDGAGTSYPPGTMMTLAQFVSVRDGHDAATDAHLFLAMGNAMFDAAIAAWDAKVHYDYARPVQVIRDLGKLDLIGTPGIDALTGEVGPVITAFAGFDPETGASLGAREILVENFVTYQSPSGDFSPPFAEYVSGHSTFSGAAAAVLQAFTGANGLGASVVLPAGGSGFDPTFPGSSMMLSWPDFDAAAQEAGMSRIFGGIHFDDGNDGGLALGSAVGDLAADLAAQFATGATPRDTDVPFWDLFAV